MARAPISLQCMPTRFIRVLDEMFGGWLRITGNSYSWNG